MGFFDMEDTVYDDQFDKTYNFTKKGLTGDYEKDLAVLNETIETLSQLQGLDKEGRGDIYLARNNATIAATQVIKEEITKAHNSQG